jgi:hypothetical protein
MIPDSIKKNPEGEVAKKAVANIALFTSPPSGEFGGALSPRRPTLYQELR